MLRRNVLEWSRAGQDRLPPELRVSMSDFAGLRGNSWIEWIDRPQTAAEERMVQDCIRKDRPFGSKKWLEVTSRTLGWREPLPRGRLRKK
jgi:hypothetical protein